VITLGPQDNNDIKEVIIRAILANVVLDITDFFRKDGSVLGRIRYSDHAIPTGCTPERGFLGCPGATGPYGYPGILYGLR
jgi:hypothetical protein